jgi:hypothetical protein
VEVTVEMLAAANERRRFQAREDFASGRRLEFEAR